MLTRKQHATLSLLKAAGSVTTGVKVQKPVMRIQKAGSPTTSRFQAGHTSQGSTTKVAAGAWNAITNAVSTAGRDMAAAPTAYGAAADFALREAVTQAQPYIEAEAMRQSGTGLSPGAARLLATILGVAGAATAGGGMGAMMGGAAGTVAGSVRRRPIAGFGRGIVRGGLTGAGAATGGAAGGMLGGHIGGAGGSLLGVGLGALAGGGLGYATGGALLGEPRDDRYPQTKAATFVDALLMKAAEDPQTPDRKDLRPLLDFVFGDAGNMPAKSRIAPRPAGLGAPKVMPGDSAVGRYEGSGRVNQYPQPKPVQNLYSAGVAKWPDGRSRNFQSPAGVPTYRRSADVSVKDPWLNGGDPFMTLGRIGEGREDSFMKELQNQIDGNSFENPFMAHVKDVPFRDKSYELNDLARQAREQYLHVLRGTEGLPMHQRTTAARRHAATWAANAVAAEPYGASATDDVAFYNEDGLNPRDSMLRNFIDVREPQPFNRPETESVAELESPGKLPVTRTLPIATAGGPRIDAPDVSPVALPTSIQRATLPVPRPFGDQPDAARTAASPSYSKYLLPAAAAAGLGLGGYGLYRWLRRAKQKQPTAEPQLAAGKAAAFVDPLFKGAGLFYKDLPEPVPLMFRDPERPNETAVGHFRTQDPRWLTRFFSNPYKDMMGALNHYSDNIKPGLQNQPEGSDIRNMHIGSWLGEILSHNHPERYRRATVDELLRIGAYHMQQGGRLKLPSVLLDPEQEEEVKRRQSQH